MLIDARGLGCPKPVIMAEEELAKINEGAVEVLVDEESSVENLTKFASKNGFHTETVKEEGYWRVNIVKGCSCNVFAADENVRGCEKGLLLVVGTDTMGKEEELGRVLMKGFFETIRTTKELPDMIFFLNAGVKLTTSNDEIIPVLRELETMGVEIFSCGTCLKYYGFESELKVGYRGTTYNIIEGLKEFKRVIWI